MYIIKLHRNRCKKKGEIHLALHLGVYHFGDCLVFGLSCMPHFGDGCLRRWEYLQRPGQKKSGVFRLRLTKEHAELFPNENIMAGALPRDALACSLDEPRGGEAAGLCSGSMCGSPYPDHRVLLGQANLWGGGSWLAYLDLGS